MVAQLKAKTPQFRLLNGAIVSDWPQFLSSRKMINMIPLVCVAARLGQYQPQTNYPVVDQKLQSSF